MILSIQDEIYELENRGEVDKELRWAATKFERATSATVMLDRSAGGNSLVTYFYKGIELIYVIGSVWRNGRYEHHS